MDGSQLDWKDVSDEQFREYDFPTPHGVVKVRVDLPEKLNVKRSERGDSHRIIDANGGSHYIPVGWVGLHWHVKEGREPFAF